MARRRFFVSEVRRREAEITGSDAEHLVRVLRVQAGQLFELSDNNRLYLAEVITARKSSVVFRVTEDLPVPQPSVSITLCPALIKFDRFEWLIEKGTELGVDAVQPFAGTRTDHGLLAASEKRVERWRKIAFEASQQSRRVQLPNVQPAMRSLEALQVDAGVRLFLDEDTQAIPILGQLPTARMATDRVALLIGPEGGWTDEERAFALRSGWLPCRLGQTILRAETAALAGLAVIQAAWTQQPQET